ncbi:hypothetical protein Rhe02_85190 [Rhizocola hellebori]|uniref:Uncharacterized protein n=1 Tax=Rhizocola hellebori TaxID=1392758 RepID=A0A8J3VLA9_9ACTN|nr:hypothetical protein [Rhizocola hellebori]GIH10452.1 hypothetical protein Rhe02_85190 [Rhizocola hellebori]
METALDTLVALAERYSFADVAALVAIGAGGHRLTTREVAQLQQLCAFGQRLIDLDAEDFGRTDAASGSNVEHGFAAGGQGDSVPEKLLVRALECRMPQSPREKHRGALGSLRPAYELLLEVIKARFARRETMLVVATVHIASEYAPLLAWENVLGHAGDPARLHTAVTGEGSVWGEFEDRNCPHTKPEKSAAKRVLTVARENATGWRSYLDRQHSNVSRALAVCAAACRQPCTVYTRLSQPQAESVTHGSKLALALNDSAILRLRHSAPVGHGFGVPSPAEVLQAWDHTRESLARIEPAIEQDDGYPLPGFATFVSTLAGQPMKAATLLADTSESITAVLRAASPARV